MLTQPLSAKSRSVALLKAAPWSICTGFCTWQDWQTDTAPWVMQAWLQRGPLSSPLKNSNTSQSTQSGLDGPPASAQLLPAPSKYHVPTCTHINIQTHAHIGNTLSGVQLEQTQRKTATITHQSNALSVWLHHPERWSPSLHAIRFQEHWAHKPGHVLLCPVCQNNSAVSNTVRLWFHFSLPRYCRTLKRVTFPMSTSLQFVNTGAVFHGAFNLLWVKSKR